MPRPLLAALALGLLALPAAAQAQAQAPVVSRVEVVVGPDLAARTDELGARELDYLSADLKAAVERRLARGGALSPEGGRLTLVIDDATPNRPTMRQLGAKPGLSLLSFGIGGARISGEYVAADGARAPIRYSWYEDDIRQAAYSLTWSDAETAFDRLARRLGKGQFVRD